MAFVNGQNFDSHGMSPREIGERLLDLTTNGSGRELEIIFDSEFEASGFACAFRVAVDALPAALVEQITFARRCGDLEPSQLEFSYDKRNHVLRTW